MVIIKEQTNSYGNQIIGWKKEDRVKKYIRRGLNETIKHNNHNNHSTKHNINNKINQKEISRTQINTTLKSRNFVSCNYQNQCRRSHRNIQIVKSSKSEIELFTSLELRSIATDWKYNLPSTS